MEPHSLSCRYEHGGQWQTVDSLAVSADAIQKQLVRIFSSDGFANSDRLKLFLRYAVERTLAGDVGSLKETVIGVEVFGRPVGYDPKADAIVRVEAYRLRQRLRHYYDVEGQADPIRVHLAKGSYAVQFEEQVISEPAAAASATPIPRASRRPRAMVYGALAGAAVMAIAFAGYRWFAGGPPAHSTIEKLTSDGGWSGDAAFFPDGGSVIYSSDRGTEQHLSLWRLSLSGGEPVRITHEPFDAVEADVSPDGAQVVYRSKRGDAGGLYLISATGGAPQLLVQGGSRPRFSPDGRWLVYTVRNEQEWSAGRIYVLPTTPSSAPREMAQNFADAHYAIWSDDGKAILFCGTRISGLPEAEHDWWVIPFPNGQPVKTGVYPNILRYLRSGNKVPPNPFIEMPGAWARGYVYFASSFGAPVSLWRLKLDSSSFAWSGQPEPQRLTSGASIDIAPRVRQEQMVFASGTNNLDIWSQMLVAKTGESKGLAQRLVSHPTLDSFPSVGRDQHFLAYASERNGGRSIFVRDLRDQSERLLQRSQFAQDYPAISRSGGRVAFRELQQPKVPIFIGRADGSEVTMACPDCGGPTDWSIDDRYILFEPGATIAYVGRLNLATGQAEPLLTHPERSLRGARYSPDGRWLAFYEETGKDTRRIWLAPADRSSLPREWTTVTDGDHADVSPTWSPDGSLLYFLSDRDGNRCVYARKVDLAVGRPVGEPFEVQHFHGARRSLLRLTRSRVAAVGLSILPDRMVFAMDEQTSDLYMATVR